MANIRQYLFYLFWLLHFILSTKDTKVKHPEGMGMAPVIACNLNFQHGEGRKVFRVFKFREKVEKPANKLTVEQTDIQTPRAVKKLSRNQRWIQFVVIQSSPGSIGLQGEIVHKHILLLFCLT